MSNVTTTRPEALQADHSYLTPEDLQRELRLSRATIYCILRSGELPHVRFKRKIRVRREVFEEWRKASEESSAKENPTADPEQVGRKNGTQAKENSAYGRIIPD
jgi:excisionase family DNA binding protein